MSRLRTLAIAASFVLLSGSAAAAGSFRPERVTDRLTAAELLGAVDGAQALAGAVLYVDEAEVLDFSLLDVLDDRRSRFVLFAPTNAAFEDLLGLDEGSLAGLSAEAIAQALDGLVPASAVAEILLKHVVVARRVDVRTGSVAALLLSGTAEAADGSTLAFGLGSDGVQVNDSIIVVGDVPVRNGVVHFIESVL